MFPAEEFCLGSRETADTAAYHFRPFGRPVVECFLGGDLARDLSRAALPRRSTSPGPSSAPSSAPRPPPPWTRST